MLIVRTEPPSPIGIAFSSQVASLLFLSGKVFKEFLGYRRP